MGEPQQDLEGKSRGTGGSYAGGRAVSRWTAGIWITTIHSLRMETINDTCNLCLFSLETTQIFQKHKVSHSILRPSDETTDSSGSAWSDMTFYKSHVHLEAINTTPSLVLYLALALTHKVPIKYFFTVGDKSSSQLV